MTSDQAKPTEYYFNTRTRMVEKGRVSAWDHLMGPYATEEEAQQALEKAQARVEEWDEADEKWRDDD